MPEIFQLDIKKIPTSKGSVAVEQTAKERVDSPSLEMKDFKQKINKHLLEMLQENFLLQEEVWTR